MVSPNHSMPYNPSNDPKHGTVSILSGTDFKGQLKNKSFQKSFWEVIAQERIADSMSRMLLSQRNNKLSYMKITYSSCWPPHTHKWDSSVQSHQWFSSHPAILPWDSFSPLGSMLAGRKWHPAFLRSFQITSLSALSSLPYFFSFPSETKAKDYGSVLGARLPPTSLWKWNPCMCVAYVCSERRGRAHLHTLIVICFNTHSPTSNHSRQIQLDWENGNIPSEGVSSLPAATD